MLERARVDESLLRVGQSVQSDRLEHLLLAVAFQPSFLHRRLAPSGPLSPLRFNFAQKDVDRTSGLARLGPDAVAQRGHRVDHRPNHGHSERSVREVRVARNGLDWQDCPVR